MDGQQVQQATGRPYSFDLATPAGAGTLLVSGSLTGAGGGTVTTAAIPIHYDNVGPAVTVTSGPGLPAWQWGSRTFAFTADDPRGATVTCALDDGALAPCTTASTFTTTTKVPGAHTLRLHAVDGLGNVTEVTQGFTVLRHLRARTTLSITHRGGSSKVTGLKVLRPRGSTAVLRCRGCTKAIASAVGRSFRPGETLQVRVAKAGLVGLVKTYIFRRTGQPTAVLRCLPPGRTTPQRCTARLG